MVGEIGGRLRAGLGTVQLDAPRGKYTDQANNIDEKDLARDI